eukprot:350168-Chlamydomonas_euryale.AAC.2
MPGHAGRMQPRQRTHGAVANAIARRGVGRGGSHGQGRRACRRAHRHLTPRARRACRRSPFHVNRSPAPASQVEPVLAALRPPTRRPGRCCWPVAPAPSVEALACRQRKRARTSRRDPSGRRARADGSCRLRLPPRRQTHFGKPTCGLAFRLIGFRLV